MARGLRRKTLSFLNADEETKDNKVKTVRGYPMILVAYTAPGRPGGDPTWWYHFGDGEYNIYYNHEQEDKFYIPAGFDAKSMKPYSEIFVLPPLTINEQAWLDRNRTEIITGN